MDIKDATDKYLIKTSQDKGNVRHISLSLRRNKIETLEELKKEIATNPKKIEDMRGIGPYRMKILLDMVRVLDKEN